MVGVGDNTSNGSRAERDKEAREQSRRGQLDDVLLPLGSQCSEDTDTDGHGCHVGEGAQGVLGDEVSSWAERGGTWHDHLLQLSISDELVGDEFERDQLRNLQDIRLGHTEHECQWPQNVAKDELQGQGTVGIRDVERSSNPGQNTVDGCHQ